MASPGSGSTLRRALGEDAVPRPETLLAGQVFVEAKGTRRGDSFSADEQFSGYGQTRQTLP